MYESGTDPDILKPVSPLKALIMFPYKKKKKGITIFFKSKKKIKTKNKCL